MTTFVKSRLKAFRYAWDGLVDFFVNQEPVLVHLVAVGVAVGTAWYLGYPTWKWTVFVLCIGFTLVTEALNTAVEYVVDLVSPEYHVLAGKAKDVAAAAVALSALTAFTIYFIFLWDALAS